MAIHKAGFRGKVSIRGRPKEQAKAEIMIMKQKEAYEYRKSKRRFFFLLDIIAFISLIIAIYSFYQGSILRGLLSLLVGVLILIHFALRKRLRQKKK